jgi:hypothetical protein
MNKWTDGLIVFLVEKANHVPSSVLGARATEVDEGAKSPLFGDIKVQHRNQT